MKFTKYLKHLRSVFTSVGLLTLIAFPLHAAASYSGAPNTVYFTDMIHAGKGCPSGTLDYTITEDGKKLTILFDSYEVEINNLPRKSKKQVACNIGMNIHVPSGFAVSLINAEYDGYLDLPWEAKAKLMRKYFFSGGNSVKRHSKWKGALDKDFRVKDQLTALTMSWSPCGEDTVFNAHTRMVLKAPANTYAVAVVDSANFGSRTKVVYNLAYSECS